METLGGIAQEVLECTKCSLSKKRTQPVFGAGSINADLMFIGEAPGAEEDRTGIPFIGRSGKLLDVLLLEELKEKKPTTYEQYKKAIEQKKPAWVYPDLTVRIG